MDENVIRHGSDNLPPGRDRAPPADTRDEVPLLTVLPPGKDIRDLEEEVGRIIQEDAFKHAEEIRCAHVLVWMSR